MKLIEKHQLFIDLLIGMTEKELTARYKHTVFGFLWVFINPLIQMLVIGFIFPFFLKEPITNYSFYLLIGLLIWNFFTLSVLKTTPAIVFERALIKKAKFPHAVIPLSIILSNMVNLIIAFALLMIPLLFLHLFSVTRFIFFIIGIILLLVFTTGFSLLTSALNVRYRDINFFVQALTIIWFYLTPIVYSINFIPRKLIWIWRLNPMTSIVQFFQHALIDFPLPGLAMVTVNLVIIFIIVAIGVYIFNRKSRNFDDWL